MLIRKRLLRRQAAGILMLMATATWTGCTGSAGTGPTADGKHLLLEAEPTESTGVLDLKSAMITGIAPDGGALLGRVVSGQDWEPNQAMFLIRDLNTDTLAAHDHGGDDHSECAFCQAKANDTGSMALVQVIDDQGEVMSTDPRKLLGLEEGQAIVAEGSGMLDEDGTLVFQASKIFIRAE